MHEAFNHDPWMMLFRCGRLIFSQDREHVEAVLITKTDTRNTEATVAAGDGDCRKDTGHRSEKLTKA